MFDTLTDRFDAIFTLQTSTSATAGFCATFGHQGTIACPIASNDLDQPLDEPTANWLELGTEPRGRWGCVTASTHWRASVPQLTTVPLVRPRAEENRDCRPTRMGQDETHERDFPGS